MGINFKDIKGLPDHIKELVRKSTGDGTSPYLKTYKNIVVEVHGNVTVYVLNESEMSKFKGITGKFLYLRAECYVKNGEVIKNRWN